MIKTILLIILVSSLFFAGCSNTSQDYGPIAKCLTEKGAIMYGTEWCSHCKNQKKAFGQSFEFVNFVDCDAQAQLCSDAGIEGYPTWIIDGKLYPGEQSIERLDHLTDCKLFQN